MFRKRTSALLIAAALLPAGFARALGLGEINLSSALDEPLRAEIRLRGAGELSADQIRVRLASGAEFERAGVERLYSLTELRFAVEVGEGGNGVVRISTEQPVREPYLDFLVEVKWPNGRVLREYTLLLDLPTYKPAPPPAVQAPVSRAPARPSVSPRSDGGGAWSGGDRYQVVSGDTLWSIAQRTRPSGSSVQDMMEALHAGSPEAFIGGDINRLRAGAVLRVPLSADEMASLSASAPAAVSFAPASSTPAPAAEAASEIAPTVPPSPGESDYLRLAGESSATASDAAGGETGAEGTGSVVEDRLAAAQETLSAKERENAELQARVKALEDQVQNFQRLVELKSEGATAAQSGSAKPAAPPAPVEASGPLDWILGNALAVGAAVLALAGVAVALLLRRRKASALPDDMPELEPRYQAPKKEPEFMPAQHRAEEARGVSPVAVAAASPARELAPEEPAAPPGPSTDVTPAPAETPVAAASTASERELTDPLSEADIYIAYGRLERAVDVLTRALARDPDEHDLRLKLLEIFVEQRNGEAFAAQYKELLSIGDPELLEAAVQIARESGHLAWLDGLATPAAPPAANPAPALAVAVGAAEGLVDSDAPELARFDVEADTGLGLDLDLDLDLGVDEKSEESVDDGVALDLEDLELGDLGTLELGGVETAPEASAAALDELAPLELGELEPHPEPASVGAGTEEQADLDLLAGSDEVETRLELARAFIDMGDVDGARDILHEVMSEGTGAQRDEALRMLDALRPA